MSSNQQPPVPPYPGAQPPPAGKPKKPWFKKWWVWVLGILILLGAVNALGGGGSGNQAATPSQNVSSNTPAAEQKSAEEKPAEEPKKERLTLEDGWEIDKSNPYAIFVTGYVANNSDKPVDNYIQITFDALDKEGANVGSCLANTNTVDAQGKWKFKAMCTGEVEDIETVRFKEITGF